MHQKKHTLLQHHICIPETALIELPAAMLPLYITTFASMRLEQPCLKAASTRKKKHTLLQHHICNPEHALVELAQFLTYRTLYLDMPPLDNTPVESTDLQ